jgi:chromosome partitioning protein
MKVITFVTQKGGTGKTTLAASLGVAAEEAGERVYLIDLDPQGSLMGWGERRQAETPAVDQTTPDKLTAALTGLEKAGYSLVIIDTQGVDTAATSAAMRAADLAIIPARASVLDIEAAKPTMAALTRLGRPYAFVLNHCAAGRASRMQDAGRALSLLGVLAEPFVVQRTDHMDALAFGLGVTEHDTHGKAAREIRELWMWVRRKMEGKAHGKAARVA